MTVRSGTWAVWDPPRLYADSSFYVTEKKAESWKLLFQQLTDLISTISRYQEQRKKHKMRTVQVNTGVSVNWLTGWRIMQPGLSDAHVFFFVHRTGRRAQSCLMRRLMVSMKKKINIRNNQLINDNNQLIDNQFNRLKQWVICLFLLFLPLLKKQKWKPLKRIPAVKILHQSKRPEGRNSKSLCCVFSCESVAHCVHKEPCVLSHRELTMCHTLVSVKSLKIKLNALQCSTLWRTSGLLL